MLLLFPWRPVVIASAALVVDVAAMMMDEKAVVAVHLAEDWWHWRWEG